MLLNPRARSVGGAARRVIRWVERETLGLSLYNFMPALAHLAVK